MTKEEIEEFYDLGRLIREDYQKQPVTSGAKTKGLTIAAGCISIAIHFDIEVESCEWYKISPELGEKLSDFIKKTLVN